MVESGTIHYVTFNPDNITVRTTTFGSDEQGLKDYTNINDLPVWMHRAVATLFAVPESSQHREIEGIGRRRSADVFCVYEPVDL